MKSRETEPTQHLTAILTALFGNNWRGDRFPGNGPSDFWELFRWSKSSYFNIL